MGNLLLGGLDAQNPLGFLAALGLLRVLDDQALAAQATRPRLSFRSDDGQTAELWTHLSLDETIDAVLADAAQQAENPLLRLAYDDDGNRVEPEAPGARRDLKPTPGLARQVLREASMATRRVADLAAGFFSELVQDNNGNTKPTGLHFTAGQQAFLAMVNALREGIGRDALSETLVGPWENTSSLPSLSWDSSVSRQYALRAGDPSKDKRGSVPAANWLGFQALAFFPVNKTGRYLVTTAMRGGWKDSVFTWPVWQVPCSVPAVSSLLRTRVERFSSKERAALGISAVFSARVLRSDQGGYGSFSPAEFVLPQVRRGTTT